jgi:chemotaxis protein methyltransferase CheR
MVLRDDFPQLAGWRIEILGTDLSPSVLERARAGTYTTFEVQRGLPIKLLVRHFEEAPNGWRIKDELRRDIRFASANLLHSITALGTFDIVFCRNVLIYFDRPTKSAVLDKIAGRLAPDGALFLGGSESIFGVCDRFTELPGLRGVYAHIAAAERSSGTAPKEPNRIATRVA